MADNKENKELLDEGIADAIMELPHVFYVNDERFFQCCGETQIIYFKFHVS